VEEANLNKKMKVNMYMVFTHSDYITQCVLMHGVLQIDSAELILTSYQSSSLKDHLLQETNFMMKVNL